MRILGPLSGCILALVIFSGAGCEEFDLGMRTETFDGYWEAMARQYPYFEMYGVDWHVARLAHRERALSAQSHDAFVHELARMFARLDDPHLMFYPPLARWRKEGRRWTIPQLQVIPLRDGVVAIRWPDGEKPEPPERFRTNPDVLPLIRSIDGTPPAQAVSLILLAGPPGTKVELGLEWPDGGRTYHSVTRPETSPRHERFKLPRVRWIRARRFGEVGYLALLTFDPRMTEEGLTLSEMRRCLLDAVEEIKDAKKLVLDMRYNGGGQLQLVIVLLNRFLNRPAKIRLQQGDFDLKPLDPHYHGEVVILMNEFCGSGGEWFPAFMQRYRETPLVGGITQGAEASVTRIHGKDGSTLAFGFNNLTEEQGFTFQRDGVKPDHPIPLTVERVRTLGAETAIKQTERERLRKALDLLEIEDPTAEIEDAMAEWCEYLIDYWLEEYGKLSVPEFLD